jgi:hypothetical protein
MASVGNVEEGGGGESERERENERGEMLERQRPPMCWEGKETHTCPADADADTAPPMVKPGVVLGLEVKPSALTRECEKRGGS